jgi:hypothetical protein
MLDVSFVSSGIFGRQQDGAPGQAGADSIQGRGSFPGVRARTGTEESVGAIGGESTLAGEGRRSLGRHKFGKPELTMRNGEIEQFRRAWKEVNGGEES